SERHAQLEHVVALFNLVTPPRLTGGVNGAAYPSAGGGAHDRLGLHGAAERLLQCPGARCVRAVDCDNVGAQPRNRGDALGQPGGIFLLPAQQRDYAHETPLAAEHAALVAAEQLPLAQKDPQVPVDGAWSNSRRIIGALSGGPERPPDP